MYYFPYFLTVNFFNYSRLPLITILRDEHVYPSCFYLTPGIGIQQRTRSVYVLRRINIYTPYRVMYIILPIIFTIQGVRVVLSGVGGVHPIYKYQT